MRRSLNLVGLQQEAPGPVIDSATNAGSRTVHLPISESRALPFFDTLISYWRSKFSEGQLPRKASIDPTEIPQLLPNLLLIDIARNPYRFTYRLSGSKAEAIHGHTLTGLCVSNLRNKPFKSELTADLIRLAEDGKPQFLELSLRDDKDQENHYTIMRLPLLGYAGQIDHILIGIDAAPGRSNLASSSSIYESA